MSVEDFKLPSFTPEPPKQAAPKNPILDVHTRNLMDRSESRPVALHAEMTILGAMLVEPTAVADAMRQLDLDDFALDSHRRIYTAMWRLVESKTDVDIVTLSDHLSKKKELDSVGGLSYLASLSEGLPRKLSIESYVRIVRDKSLLRQLMTICDGGMIDASDQSQEAMAVFKTLSSKLKELAESGMQFRANRKVLIGAHEFIAGTQANVEWTVVGLIQRGGNGIIVGDPGTAKSFSALDLAHHLVAGVPWMGHEIPNRMKVAFVAREDHPGLTQQRATSLLRGYAGGPVDDGLSEVELNDWLYYNTRAQSETFSLQNEMDVLEIIDAFKEKGIEFAVFDVFRRLWEGDENDNQEVAKVLATLTRIQTECACSVVLVHHLNKGEGGGNIFKRIRGASSIYGWREWAFGISIENPEDDPKDRIRKMEFETKAATPSSPIYYCFDGDADKVEIATCAPPVSSYKKSDRNNQKSEPKQDVLPWYAK